MIPKSGYRFSDQIMPKQISDDLIQRSWVRSMAGYCFEPPIRRKIGVR